MVVTVLVLGAMIVWKDQESAKLRKSVPQANAPHNHGESGQPSGANMAPVAEMPRAPSQLDIQGVIKLDPSIADAAPSAGAFYLMARPAGTAGGPPIAVIKLAASTQDVPFTIGPADLMMGGNFDQPVSLSVRWDQDGDPLTRQDSDLVGAAAEASIKPGTQGVVVLINKKHGTNETSNVVINPQTGEVGRIPQGQPESAPESAPAGDGKGASITGKITLSPELKAQAPQGASSL